VIVYIGLFLLKERDRMTDSHHYTQCHALTRGINSNRGRRKKTGRVYNVQ